MGWFGGNESKTVTETVVSMAIDATLEVTSSKSVMSNNVQELNMSGNKGVHVDGVDMNQVISVKLKSENTTTASTSFSSAINAALLERIKQSTEAGSLQTNSVETLTQTVHQFSVDCGRVFKDNLSVFVSSSQVKNINTNTDSSFKNIKMYQTVESSIEAMSAIILSDAAVQETKSLIDKQLDQKTEGFSGIIKNLLGGLVGPLVILAIIAIVCAAVYFKFRS